MPKLLNFVASIVQSSSVHPAGDSILSTNKMSKKSFKEGTKKKIPPKKIEKSWVFFRRAAFDTLDNKPYVNLTVERTNVHGKLVVKYSTKYVLLIIVDLARCSSSNHDIGMVRTRKKHAATEQQYRVLTLASGLGK